MTYNHHSFVQVCCYCSKAILCSVFSWYFVSNEIGIKTKIERQTSKIGWLANFIIFSSSFHDKYISINVDGRCNFDQWKFAFHLKLFIWFHQICICVFSNFSIIPFPKFIVAIYTCCQLRKIRIDKSIDFPMSVLIKFTVIKFSMSSFRERILIDSVLIKKKHPYERTMRTKRN